MAIGVSSRYAGFVDFVFVDSTLSACDTGADWIDHVGGAVVPKEASDFSFRETSVQGEGWPKRREIWKWYSPGTLTYGCFQK